MVLKYISFLIGLTWSYSLIKTQSIFSKKAGLIFKLFITKVSWLTFLAAVYFGYKNFSIEYTFNYFGSFGISIFKQTFKIEIYTRTVKFSKNFFRVFFISLDCILSIYMN